ncbi:MAG: hypothetical protein F4X99_02735, partial [Gammaproteobacteria bacterium]|nr:hypothetical protein [Gammaproteobacteria bacterium]
MWGRRPRAGVGGPPPPPPPLLAPGGAGDGSVYLEKYLARPRHIEFQILGDGQRAAALFERECSVQRRHQKLIEESPAPNVDRDAVDAVAARAASALEALGYDSLGTVETLLADGEFGFLETNARLQVEHGVTEEVTGVDLVAAQIRGAGGGPRAPGRGRGVLTKKSPRDREEEVG